MVHSMCLRGRHNREGGFYVSAVNFQLYLNTDLDENWIQTHNSLTLDKYNDNDDNVYSTHMGVNLENITQVVFILTTPYSLHHRITSLEISWNFEYCVCGELSLLKDNIETTYLVQ